MAGVSSVPFFVHSRSMPNGSPSGAREGRNASAWSRNSGSPGTVSTGVGTLGPWKACGTSAWAARSPASEANSKAVVTPALHLRFVQVQV